MHQSVASTAPTLGDWWWIAGETAVFYRPASQALPAKWDFLLRTNTKANEHKIVYSKPVKEAPRQIIEEELSSHNDSTKHTLQKDFMHFMLPYEDIAIYFRF